MKVTLEIKLRNGMVLPVTAEMSTLADVRKLGAKLSALPQALNKLMGEVSDEKIDAMRIVKEREAAAAAA